MSLAHVNEANVNFYKKSSALIRYIKRSTEGKRLASKEKPNQTKQKIENLNVY